MRLSPISDVTDSEKTQCLRRIQSDGSASEQPEQNAGCYKQSGMEANTESNSSVEPS